MKAAAKKELEKRPGLLTAKQLAEALQVSETTIHRLRRAGRIPAVLVTDRIIRFSWRDVRAALGGHPPPSETGAEDDRQLAFQDIYTDFH
ncbi:MAG: helix-turn-helix domain-containing protein [Acidobacteria bacterium]|nr:helix-turn-helix domain-containing protein [Acidobacteriota bacterium]